MAEAPVVGDPVEAFMMAVLEGKLDTVQDLLKDVDVNSRAPPAVATAVVKREGYRLGQTYADNMTAAMMAAYADNRDMLKLLVDNGANLTLQSTGGTTALGFACWTGSVGIATDLAGYGVDVFVGNAQGSTALHGACLRGHVDVARFLIKDMSMDPNDKNAEGATALHAACRSQNPALAYVLVLELGASPFEPDNAGSPPSMTAFQFARYGSAAAIYAAAQAKGLAFPPPSGGDTDIHAPFFRELAATAAKFPRRLSLWVLEGRELQSLPVADDLVGRDAWTKAVTGVASAIASPRLAAVNILVTSWQALEGKPSPGSSPLATMLSLRRVCRTRPGTEEVVEPFGRDVVGFL